MTISAKSSRPKANSKIAQTWRFLCSSCFCLISAAADCFFAPVVPVVFEAVFFVPAPGFFPPLEEEAAGFLAVFFCVVVFLAAINHLSAPKEDPVRENFCSHPKTALFLGEEGLLPF